MTQISITAFGSYVPQNRLSAESFGRAHSPGNPTSGTSLTAIPRYRHHVAGEERAAEMIERAACPMFEDFGIDPAGNVDILLTNVLLPDALFTGSGSEAAHRLGCTPEVILDLHNGGCASFPYMVQLARSLMTTGQGCSALIANVQNSAGQVFAQDEVRTRPHAALPGDGCGVAYLQTGGRSPVLSSYVKNSPQFARDVRPVRADGRKYWEPGAAQLDVEFDAELGSDIIGRGNRLVPEVVVEACRRAQIAVSDVDILITNQPNRIFLKNWRDELGLKSYQHIDTFDLFGNLYGAAAPITVDWALREGSISPGDIVVIAGFAHAGDFAAACVLGWQNDGEIPRGEEAHLERRPQREIQSLANNPNLRTGKAR